VRCTTCGAEHDWSDLEPVFHRPDAYLEVPESEREHRTLASNDDCRIRDADDTWRRYFLRVLMPIPVRGEARDCRWGLWVEVSAATFARVRALWDQPGQAGEPPFAATVANTVRGYPATLGLPGQFRLTGPTTPPFFHFDPAVDHPLAAEQRAGVFPERILEWLHEH